MKKLTFLMLLLFIAGLTSYAQKKSGVVYSEHESISVTQELWKAAVSGDEAKYRSYFADSAMIVRNDNNPPIQANAQIGKGLANWSKAYDNLKVEDQKPAFPDALEYKEGGIWVQDWLLMTGVHKETGIIVDLPMHNLYSFNEEGKITMMISYFNNDVFQEIGRSRTSRENGTVYINHPHIVSVRKLINAFAAGDFDTWASFYSPEARFSTASMELNESVSVEEYEQILRDTYFKEGLKFKIEQVGYPDCIYYAQNDMYVVYSWWKMTVMKDGQKSEIPFMLSHDFNDEGKIDFARVYVSSNHMEKL